MSTQSTVVYREIQQILGSYAYGISVSSLCWLEIDYQLKFSKSLDYESLGVKDITELLYKMCDERMLVLSEDPESKKEYVMSRVVKNRQKVFLKRNVQELLQRYGGGIPLSSFDGIYKDNYMAKLKYHLYDLTGVDHLCEVLNLVAEAANSGEMVIKACKNYNLRKRKK